MEVEDFNVEMGYDFLIVNGEQFSGTTTPHGKVGKNGHQNNTITKTADLFSVFFAPSFSYIFFLGGSIC